MEILCKATLLKDILVVEREQQKSLGVRRARRKQGERRWMKIKKLVLHVNDKDHSNEAAVGH